MIVGPASSIGSVLTIECGKMRVHFSYRHIEQPWGGANNFIRTLRGQMEAYGRFEFTDSINEACDVMFMNQLGLGPASGSSRLRISKVRNLVRQDNRRLVVRAVNLYRHAFRLGPRNLIFGTLADRGTMSLLNIAHMVVFQSAYQAAIFVAAGFRGVNFKIVHNGADPAFWNEAGPVMPQHQRLRLISATASPRATKRHDLIARISRIPGVEVLHCGAWPLDVDSASVQKLGTVDRYSMAKLFASAHLFLHPAIKDPCPNAIFEAICSGLPVLYNAGPGSSAEIVGDCGLAIAENAPEDTVAIARARLADLHEIVRLRRQYYRVERASAAYAAIIESQC